MTREMFRLPILDAIRGLAALSVLVTHVGAVATVSGHDSGVLFGLIQGWNWCFRQAIWCNGGLHAGVIIFIVLSGFCIHLPLARNPDAAEAPLFWRVYAEKRAKRILPVYWFSILLGLGSLVACEGSRVSGELAGLVTATAAAAAMAPAVIPGVYAPGNEITQTVAVEFLLYALYPVGLYAWRLLGTAFLLGFAVFLYASNLSFLTVLNCDPAWVGRNLFASFLYWWLGALAARLTFRDRAGPWLSSLATTALLYVAYVGLCHSLSFRGSHYFKSALLAIVAAQALLATARHRHLFGSGRLLGGLCVLGTISYSLYASHIPLLNVLSARQVVSSSSNDVWLGSAFLLSIGLATLVHFCIERPSHEWAKNTATRPPSNPSEP